MLLLTGVGVMGTLGYRLIETNVVYFLLGLLVILALGGLALWFARNFSRTNVRMLMGVACAMAVAAIAMVMFVFFSFVNGFYTPQICMRLKSETGREAVVLRQISQRYAYDRAKDSPNSAIQFEDLGYSYQIYPVFSKIFYNSNQKAEGEMEIGCASQASPAYEWNGDTLRLFIENPEPFDTGELILR